MFLAGRGLLDGLDTGSRYVLEGDEARHAGVVQRRRPGERVDVVDGAGVRLRCVITGVEVGRVSLDVVERSEEPAPAVPLVLAQALAKGDRDELAIEAATELGVDAVIPWQAARSVVVWRGDRAAKSRAKWVATVRRAAKQSRRAQIPAVEPPVDTRGLAELVREVVLGGGVALVLHEGAPTPLTDAGLPDLTAAEDARGVRTGVLVVVGPEGGIGDEELTELTDAGATAVRLGPHVLRTSTAGPAALVLLSQLLGRWA